VHVTNSQDVNLAARCNLILLDHLDGVLLQRYKTTLLGIVALLGIVTLLAIELGFGDQEQQCKVVNDQYSDRLLSQAPKRDE